jgi:hypothetical protein
MYRFNFYKNSQITLKQKRSKLKLDFQFYFNDEKKLSKAIKNS